MNSIVHHGSHSFNLISTAGDLSLFNVIPIILNAEYGKIKTSCSYSNKDRCSISNAVL